MIVKYIRNPKKSASKGQRVRGVVDYARCPETEDENVKCILSGALNFLTADPEGQVMEMTALASESVRSRDPIKHYVLSWPADERPTLAQVKQAVALFLRFMGLERHQCIYALHDDTDNLHLHVIINRVHPDTGKAVDINKGLDLEQAHQAVAQIERAQGWRPELNARYQIKADGTAERREQEEDGAAALSPRARNFEAMSGEVSTERLALERGGHFLRSATSWAELHQQLDAVDMRYERVLTGAKIWVGDVPLKASTVDRKASFSAMEKRLGPYVPPPRSTSPKESLHEAQQTQHITAAATADLLRRAFAISKSSADRARADDHDKARTRLCDLPRRRVVSHPIRDQLLLQLLPRDHLGRQTGAGDQLRRTRAGSGNPPPKNRTKASGRLTTKYIVADPQAAVRSRPGPRRATDELSARYHDERLNHQAGQRDRRDRLRVRHQAEKGALVDQQRADRASTLFGSQKRTRAEFLSRQKEIAIQQRAERACLADVHRNERKALSAQIQPFAGWRQWLRNHRDHEREQAKVQQEADARREKTLRDKRVVEAALKAEEEKRVARLDRAIAAASVPEKKPVVSTPRTGLGGLRGLTQVVRDFAFEVLQQVPLTRRGEETGEAAEAAARAKREDHRQAELDQGRDAWMEREVRAAFERADPRGDINLVVHDTMELKFDEQKFSKEDRETIHTAPREIFIKLHVERSIKEGWRASSAAAAAAAQEATRRQHAADTSRSSEQAPFAEKVRQAVQSPSATRALTTPVQTQQTQIAYRAMQKGQER